MAGNPNANPGSPEFCDGYSAVPDIESLIANSKDDFFVRYRIWQDRGSPGGPAMLTIFGNAEASARALTLGHVLEKDCAPFNDFVSSVGSRADESVRALGGQVERGADPARDLFEVAVVKLFVTRERLGEWERGALNGALLVQANLATTPIGSGADRRTYGIPAFVILPWMQNANKGLWNAVDKIIEDAFEATASRMINVTGVVQIRLGGDGQPLFEPVVVAPGFTIMGGV